MNVERMLARLAVDAAQLVDEDWWFQHAPPKAEEHPREFVEFVLQTADFRRPDAPVTHDAKEGRSS